MYKDNNMNNIEKINEELYYQLNEMATIFTGTKMSVIVNPDPGRNHYKVEYFKAFHGDSFRKATDIARIRFRDPGYEIHNSGKENFKLNSKDRKELIRILTLPSDMYDNYTMWQDCIMQFNHEAYHISFKQCLKLTQSYLDTLDDKDPIKKYLPIDLPMPNYLELK